MDASWLVVVRGGAGADLIPLARRAIQFLTATGQMCSGIRQEFILLSDIFGLSALVDTMNHPKPANSNATEATVLGYALPLATCLCEADHCSLYRPFFTEDSHDVRLILLRVSRSQPKAPSQSPDSCRRVHRFRGQGRVHVRQGTRYRSPGASSLPSFSATKP